MAQIVQIAALDLPKTNEALRQVSEQLVRLEARLNDLATPTLPSCLVYNSVVKSIAHNTETDMTWNSHQHDTGGFHSLQANTDQIVIPSEGTYLVGAFLIWDTHSDSGQRLLTITLNDPAPAAAAAKIADHNIIGISLTSFVWNSAQTLRRFAANDILRVSVLQTSTVSLNVLDTTTYGPRANGFYCIRLSD